jgi:hypothetical protein
MNTRADHVVETSKARGKRRTVPRTAVAVRTSLASTSFLYDALSPQNLQAMRKLPFELARIGVEPGLLRQYLPKPNAFSRAIHGRVLGFLRENGFKPLVELFTLSPRLGAAFAIPFALTSLFGILSFGMEAVLIAALGSFFALIAANDAAERLLKAATNRENRPAQPPVPEPPLALPAPAPVALLGAGAALHLDDRLVWEKNEADRNAALLREGV